MPQNLTPGPAVSSEGARGPLRLDAAGSTLTLGSPGGPTVITSGRPGVVLPLRGTAPLVVSGRSFT